MKSAVASMCAAILNRKDYNFKNKNIILALVSGEETGCEGSKLLAKKLQKEKISVIISGEPTDNYPLLGHKGVLWLEASVSGKTLMVHLHNMELIQYIMLLIILIFLKIIILNIKTII